MSQSDSPDDPADDAPADGDGDEPVVVDAQVDDVDADVASVGRTASIAEVVNEPREILEDHQFDTDFDLYDRLLEIDPELAGTVRAQAQLASGFELVHPTTTGDQEEPTDDDKQALKDCKQLIQDLDLDIAQPSMFKNMIAMGNDVSKIIYEDGQGVTGLQSLPLRSLTIIDDDTEPEVISAHKAAAEETAEDGEIDLQTYKDHLNTDVIQAGDYYVLNEGDETMKMIESWKVLHLAVERRGNWWEDKFGRQTYGVWGAPRVEPTKFSLQAKHNTLTNKVAMDDSLIAREVYHIDVATLFGHISNDERREEKAKEYAKDLKQKLEKMGPDEKPILPDEVEVNVQGPQGKAKEHGDFLDLMNDSIMHALTFNVSGVGRDAQGPMIGNRPAKDTSMNNVRHLREIMGRQFRRLFKVHLLLKHPEWREEMPDPEDVSTWKLSEDITLPVVEWAQLEDGDTERIVNAAVKAKESNIITRNEAREMMGLDPLEPDSVDKLFEDQRRNMEIQDEFNKRQQERQQEQQDQEQEQDDDQNQDDSGNNGNGGDGSSEDEDAAVGGMARRAAEMPASAPDREQAPTDPFVSDFASELEAAISTLNADLATSGPLDETAEDDDE